VRLRLRVAAVACAALIVAGGCGQGVKVPPPDLEAQDFRFRTPTKALTAGRQVTLRFANTGKVVHNLTIPSISVDLDIEPGATRTVIFVAPDTPGPLEIFCKFHQDRGMKASLRVG